MTTQHNALPTARKPLDLRALLDNWVTLLALHGIRDSLILYNARTHRIAIVHEECGVIQDHTLADVHERRQEWESCRQRARELFYESHTDQEFVPNIEEEGPEPPMRHPDEVPFENEEDQNPGGVENYYDTLPSRPAGHVLRDMARWFIELRETPGNGYEWDHEYIAPLYRKHGWPGPDFDSKGFVLEEYTE